MRLQSFHCRGCGFDPWLGNDPTNLAEKPKKKGGHMRYTLVLTEPERPLRQLRVKDKGPGSMQLDFEAPLLSPPSLSPAHLHLASAQPGGQSPPGIQSPLDGQSPPSRHLQHSSGAMWGLPHGPQGLSPRTHLVGVHLPGPHGESVQTSTHHDLTRSPCGLGCVNSARVCRQPWGCLSPIPWPPSVPADLGYTCAPLCPHELTCPSAPTAAAGNSWASEGKSLLPLGRGASGGTACELRPPHAPPCKQGARPVWQDIRAQFPAPPGS